MRVLVRNPEKTAALTAAGADIVVGDLGDRSAIDSAMGGVTGVIRVTAPVVAQELAVIESAARGRCRACRQGHQQGVDRLAGPAFSELWNVIVRSRLRD